MSDARSAAIADDETRAARFLPQSADRVSFFDEQKRRRRQGMALSLLCLFVAGTIGVMLSVFIGPIVLILLGGLLQLLATLGVEPAALHAAARGIGAWAQHHAQLMGVVADNIGCVRHRPQTRACGPILMPFLDLLTSLAPGMATAGLVWLGLRHLLLRAGTGDLLAATGARPPRPGDLGEKRVADTVEEMALAAGLPAPRVLIIDHPTANAAAAGRSHRDATLLVARGIVERFDREQCEAIIADLIAAIGNGDLRLVQSLLAIFATLGLFLTVLDLPFRVSAWSAIGRVIAAAVGRHAPEATRAALGGALSLDSAWETLNKRTSPGVNRFFASGPGKLVALLLRPFAYVLVTLILVLTLQKFILEVWTKYVLGSAVALIWRNRRYLADSTAVQLTRDPRPFLAALEALGPDAELPTGGDSRDYLFVQAPERGDIGFAAQRGLALGLFPPFGKRLERIAAQGGSERLLRLPRPALNRPLRDDALKAFVWFLFAIGSALPLVILAGFTVGLFLIFNAAGLSLVTAILGE